MRSFAAVKQRKKNMTKKSNNDQPLDSIWEYVLGDDKEQLRKGRRRRKVDDNESIIDLLRPEARDESWQHARREKKKDERDCNIAVEKKVAATKLRNPKETTKSDKKRSNEWSIDWEFDPAVTSIFSFGEENTKDVKIKKKEISAPQKQTAKIKKKETSNQQKQTGGYFFNHRSTERKHPSKTVNRRTMTKRRSYEIEQYVWELDPAIMSVFTSNESNHKERSKRRDGTAHTKHTDNAIEKKRTNGDESFDWGLDPALSKLFYMNPDIEVTTKKQKREVESRKVETTIDRQRKSSTTKESDTSVIHETRRCGVMSRKAKEEKCYGWELDSSLLVSTGENESTSQSTERNNSVSKKIGAQKRLQPKRNNDLIEKSKPIGTKNTGVWRSLTSLLVARKTVDQKIKTNGIEMDRTSLKAHETEVQDVSPDQQPYLDEKAELNVTNEVSYLEGTISNKKRTVNSEQMMRWHAERDLKSSWPNMCENFLDYSSNSFSSQASKESSFDRSIRSSGICSTSEKQCKSWEDNAADEQSISHLIEVMSNTHIRESKEKTVGVDESMLIKEKNGYFEPSSNDDGVYRTDDIKPCGIQKSPSVNSILEELEHVNAFSNVGENIRTNSAFVNVKELVSRLEKQTSTGNCSDTKEYSADQKSQTLVTYQRNGFVHGYHSRSKPTLENVSSQPGANKIHSNLDFDRKIDSILEKVEHFNGRNKSGAKQSGQLEDDDEIIFFVRNDLSHK
jgi:hypothetical protein